MTEPAADTAEFTDEAYGGPYLGTFSFARNLIAALPTFREAILNVSSAAEAKERIYYQETLADEDDEENVARENDPPPEMQPRPYCVILDGARNRPRIATCTFGGDGFVLAAFEVPVPAEYLPDYQNDDSAVKRDKFERRKRWRITLASKIEQEITELSGFADEDGNPYLNVIDIEQAVPPSDMADDVTDEPFVAFVFKLTWK